MLHEQKLPREIWTNFMQKNHKRDSSKIMTCPRWCKCYTGGLWWKPRLYTRQYWNYRSTAERFRRQIISSYTVQPFYFHPCASWWPSLLVCTRSFLLPCQIRERHRKWSRAGMCAIFRGNATNGRDWQRARFLFSQMGNRNEIDHSFSFDSSYSDIIKAGEWYEVIPFSSVVSVYHILKRTTLLRSSVRNYRGQRTDFMWTVFMSTENVSASLTYL